MLNETDRRTDRDRGQRGREGEWIYEYLEWMFAADFSLVVFSFDSLTTHSLGSPWSHNPPAHCNYSCVLGLKIFCIFKVYICVLTGREQGIWRSRKDFESGVTFTVGSISDGQAFQQAHLLTIDKPENTKRSLFFYINATPLDSPFFLNSIEPPSSIGLGP